MRPTTSAIRGTQPIDQARIPTVGLNVSASPVQTAIDESGFRSLEQLKSQLSVYNDGLRQAAQVQDKVFQTTEEAKAQQDFLKDPKGQAPENSSSYYYKTRMGLMGESYGMDVEAAAKAEAERLAANPEELYATDVKKHMTEFIQKQHAGLEDPIALMKVQSYAQKAAAATVGSLLSAKQKVIAEKNVQTGNEVIFKAFDTQTPEELTAKLQQTYQDTKGMMTPKQFAQAVLSAASAKVSTASSKYDPNTGEVIHSGAEEAQKYLDILDKGVVPGTKNTTFSMLLERTSPESAASLTKARNHVSTLSANEAAVAADFKNKLIAQNQKAYNDQQAIVEMKLEGAIKGAQSQSELGSLMGALQSSGLEDVRRVKLEEALKTRLRDNELVADGGNGVLIGAQAKAFSKKTNEDLMTLAQGGDRKMFSEAFAYKMDEMARRAPAAIEDLNSKFFSGIASSTMLTNENGTVQVHPVMRSALDAYRIIQHDYTKQVGIPDDSLKLLRIATSLIDGGESEQSALRIARDRVASGAKPLDKDRAAQLTESLTNSLQKPMFGWNISQMPDGPKQFVSRFMSENMHAFADGDMSDSDIKSMANAKFEAQTMKVRRPAHWNDWAMDSAGFIHLNGPKIQLTPNGEELAPTQVRRQVDLAIPLLLDEFKKQHGVGGVIYPHPSIPGMHVIKAEGASTGVLVPLAKIAQFGGQIERDQLDTVTKRLEVAHSVLNDAVTADAVARAEKAAAAQKMTEAQKQRASEFVGAMNVSKSLLAMDAPISTAPLSPMQKMPQGVELLNHINDLKALRTRLELSQVSVPKPPAKVTSVDKTIAKMNAR